MPDPKKTNTAAELIDDELVVRNLVVRDHDVLHEARRFAEITESTDLSTFVETALIIGAKSMRLAGTTVDVEEIRRSIDGFSDSVARSAKSSATEIARIVEAVASPTDGSLLAAVDQILKGLEQSVEALVAGEDAPVRVGVHKTVKQVTDRVLGEVQRSLQAQSETVREALNSDNPNSPLNAMRVEILRQQAETSAAVQRELAEVRKLVEVNAAIENTMQRTAIKGMNYEDVVVAMVDRLAAGAGDVAEPTGAKPGIVGSSKKGDAVITVGETVARKRLIRLVVEAKDATLSPEAWRLELDAAKKNRGAVGALGIVKGTSHMPNGSRIRVIDPLTILVAYDPAVDDEGLVAAAFHLVRAQAACIVHEGDADVDVAAIRSYLSTAAGLLVQFDKITKSATQARTHIDAVRTTADKLREDLLGCLQRALRLLDGERQSEQAA